MSGLSFIASFEMGGILGGVSLILITVAKVMKNPMYLAF
jgi:hypothetical protein